jgi:hypothetical protein
VQSRMEGGDEGISELFEGAESARKALT